MCVCVCDFFGATEQKCGAHAPVEHELFQNDEQLSLVFRKHLSGYPLPAIVRVSIVEVVIVDLYATRVQGVSNEPDSEDFALRVVHLDHEDVTVRRHGCRYQCGRIVETSRKVLGVSKLLIFFPSVMAVCLLGVVGSFARCSCVWSL